MRSSTPDYHVLVDSDAFVGRFYPDDPHHVQSKRIFAALSQQRQCLVTTSFVVVETATVLSHRTGQQATYEFLANFIHGGQIDIIHIDEPLQDAAIDVFLAQKAKGTNMTDCANVAVMKRFGIPVIFSFDQGYSRQFRPKRAISLVAKASLIPNPSD